MSVRLFSSKFRAQILTEAYLVIESSNCGGHSVQVSSDTWSNQNHAPKSCSTKTYQTLTYAGVGLKPW
ncbi:hypothetical protein RRG08_019633 [Elysia crispata]|uniref:Uncharacterized protein n=1 Tax=Elysia crispata TaxID=231223 RepID=A0AAE0ZSI2_9GAST|nr:hypothetical protein RRG08_019633 [Elysia crispata]